MDKLGDMDLLVRVIKQGGLAAAGREVGLSPARMTARINALEARYGVRLLNRTTRNVSLTDEGREFYKACERILIEVEQVELSLQSGKDNLSGPLRITSTVDLGQQHVAAVLSRFVKAHPGITPYLHLSDGLVNLADEGFDLGIRYGLLSDSNMIARKLVSNRRVLCASPDYLQHKGKPKVPEDLHEHDCLGFIRINESLSNWYYSDKDSKRKALLIKPSRSTNDGVLLRHWLLEGEGISLKSELDVHNDLKAKRLVTILDDYNLDFDAKGVSDGADLHVIYPSRHYVPKRTQCFIEVLRDYFRTFD